MLLKKLFENQHKEIKLRRFTFILLLTYLIILLPIKIPAQSISNDNSYIKTADQFVRTALTDRKGFMILGDLCKIGPRLSGSENSIKAIHWAKAKMESLGFDKVWLQPVMVPHWIRGNIEQAKIVDSKLFNNRKLVIADLGGSVNTPKAGITAEVIELKNLKELDSLKNKVKGKMVYFSRPLDAGLLNTFAGYGGAVDQRLFGPARAAQYGAVAVLIRSITTKYDNVPHTGVTIYTDTIPKIPAASLGYIDAEFLSMALKEDPSLKINLKMNCKTLPDAKSFNVIGELRGTEKPNEIIAIGGHLDSWDKGVGANDDGTGIIQSLEVLDLFKRLGIKPKRTIRCIFYINEENGTRGGIAYEKYADTAKEVQLAAIEADAGSGSPRGFSFTSDSTTIAKVKTWIPILQRAGIDWVRRGGSGEDVGQIKNAKALIGYIPDEQRYFDYHHSDNDQYSIIHPREFELGSAAIATLVYLIDREGL